MIGYAVKIQGPLGTEIILVQELQEAMDAVAGQFAEWQESEKYDKMTISYWKVPGFTENFPAFRSGFQKALNMFTR